ncbi:MAG: hypothetical protein QM756_18340 [Polyangiaceae bacterium]
MSGPLPEARAVFDRAVLERHHAIIVLASSAPALRPSEQSKG